MRSRSWKLFRGQLALALKCGSVALLFLVSVLIVACGASNATQVPGSPPVTVTINLNQTFASPTPALPPYSCGAWATQTTPGYSPSAVVQVYAKFVQNVAGNPVGMGNAHAQATVLWPAGAPTVIPTTTTSDGLAVFSVPLQPSALNKIVLVEVNFTSADGQHTCNVSGAQDAFFTAIYVSPTASPSPSPSNNPPPGPTGTPGFPFPSATSSPSTSPSPTATGRPKP